MPPNSKMKATPPKTNMTMESPPFEDGFPIENGDFLGVVHIRQFSGSPIQGSLLTNKMWSLHAINFFVNVPYFEIEQNASQTLKFKWKQQDPSQKASGICNSEVSLNLYFLVMNREDLFNLDLNMEIWWPTSMILGWWVISFPKCDVFLWAKIGILVRNMGKPRLSLYSLFISTKPASLGGRCR